MIVKKGVLIVLILILLSFSCLAITSYPASNPLGAEEVWDFNDAVTSTISKTAGTKVGCSYNADSPFDSGKSLYCDGDSSNYFDTNWHNITTGSTPACVVLWRKGIPSNSAYVFGMETTGLQLRTTATTKFQMYEAAQNKIDYQQTDSFKLSTPAWTMLTFCTSGTNNPTGHHYYYNQTEYTYDANLDELIIPEPAVNDMFFFCRSSDADNPDGCSGAGYIDQVMIFKRVLTIEEIQVLYTGNYTAPPSPNLTIYVHNRLSGKIITNFTAKIQGVGNFVSSSGINITNIVLNGSKTYNITILSTDTGGYHSRTYIAWNGGINLNASLTPYFYLSANYNFTEHKAINYTRNNSITINYTCPTIYSANIFRSINYLKNKDISITCDNTSRLIKSYYKHSTEGYYNISYSINTSYRKEHNNISTLTYQPQSDLVNPTILLHNLSITGGFANQHLNFTLICNDSIMGDVWYNNSLNNHQYIYLNYTINTTIKNGSKINQSLNTYIGTCSDLFGSTKSIKTQSIYNRQYILINERNRSIFIPANLTRARVYFDDNHTYYDFKATGKSSVNFTSFQNDKLRFEFGYTNGDIISRYIDTSLGDESQMRICVNTDPTQHYEQIILSGKNRAVSVISVYADCYIVNDYTRFVYQDSFVVKAYTTVGMYYLNTYDDDGDLIYLASMDGTFSTYYNIDVLEFSESIVNLGYGKLLLSLEKNADLNTIDIHFENKNNDSTNTQVTVKLQNGSITYYQSTLLNPNELNLILDYSTWAGFNVSNLLVVEVTTTYASGITDTIKRYFHVNGDSGIVSNGFALTVAILITLFGLTFTAVNLSLGWFGGFMQLLSIGILTLAIGGFYVTFMMVVNVVILLFIMVTFVTQYYQTVT